LEGYYIALAKPKRQTSPASFCDNIINHERKKCLLKYLFHAHYMMLEILIQENEGIAKFFTLMLEGHLNKVMEFKCNICIILGYFHSPWNLEGYCIAIGKPRVPSKTLLGSSYKWDIFYKIYILHCHYCLQPKCKDESFEEEGQISTMF
jgi:hypothetical protein